MAKFHKNAPIPYRINVLTRQLNNCKTLEEKEEYIKNLTPEDKALLKANKIIKYGR